ncbi:MAG: hypothetical protein A2Z91_07075 [Deltaproteobacteria bacterium GWA2_38_16]|nr:MAG: hypothetical protein A2Z91_07075 [Deltaproteobacteria bacterium GWA2_38_16]OGQ02368.1 MAG: hypothetical protein A3D19_05950 [Deltaproteobacteria bacterium RIFCSPHIGHO2_02_FULL_38_15]OGQ34445.1 MAG: hypothetical protein A3A72_01030 [Deltaproteobacteria bacterium RIFCSPLOWO2_01_FULL_38_9]HBQ20701.1 NADH-quinone oxidoreductase subunit N [Deltaproteobacteria bacterium]
MSNLTSSLMLYSSEIILTLTLSFVLIIHMISRNNFLTFLTALVGLAAAALAVGTLYSYAPQFYFSNHLSHDPFSLFFKLFFIVATFFTFLFSYRSYEIDSNRTAEFYLLTLSVTLGMCTLVSSLNLLTLYLSLELVSIVSYALAGFRKEHPASNEAAIKYLLYGAFASGTMLFGMSLLYGLTGSLNIYSINATLSTAFLDPLVLYSVLLMILFGFGFKISMAPFHMWAPDVYHGAPTPTAAFFTVAPKAAGFAVFIRFFYTVFANMGTTPNQWDELTNLNWALILSILSAITMTIGNLSALRQKNAKRMLAYSSIAHAGYMLMGFIVLNKQGLSSVLFYLAIYFFMNFGAFFAVGLASNKFKNEEISSFKGLGWTSPLLGVSLAIFLFSLTGIPPFGGFIGKVYLFSALVHKELYWLLLIAILNTVISLYYYTYLVREMFLQKSKDSESVALTPLHTIALLLLVIPTLVFGIYWEPLLAFVSHSLQFIVTP